MGARGGSSGRVILALPTDSHAGNRYGLCNPDTELDDGPVRLSAWQAQLWEWYSADVAAVIALAGRDPLVVAHHGDPTQGIKYTDDLQIADYGGQAVAAADNMLPWRSARTLTALALIAGTASHESGSTTMLARHLRSVFPRADVSSDGHALADIAGLRADMAHHGPAPGTRAWTRGNGLRGYLRSIVQDALMDGADPPQLVTRAHYHTYEYETAHVRARAQTWTAHGLILPAYCGLGAYGRQTTRSVSHVDVGLVAVEIVRGQVLAVHEFVRRLDVRQRRVLYDTAVAA